MEEKYWRIVGLDHQAQQQLERLILQKNQHSTKRITLLQSKYEEPALYFRCPVSLVQNFPGFLGLQLEEGYPEYFVLEAMDEKNLLEKTIDRRFEIDSGRLTNSIKPIGMVAAYFFNKKKQVNIVPITCHNGGSGIAIQIERKEHLEILSRLLELGCSIGHYRAQWKPFIPLIKNPE